jgi:hypothetical protein
MAPQSIQEEYLFFFWSLEKTRDESQSCRTTVPRVVLPTAMSAFSPRRPPEDAPRCAATQPAEQADVSAHSGTLATTLAAALLAGMYCVDVDNKRFWCVNPEANGLGASAAAKRPNATDPGAVARSTSRTRPPSYRARLERRLKARSQHVSSKLLVKAMPAADRCYGGNSAATAAAAAAMAAAARCRRGRCPRQ